MNLARTRSQYIASIDEWDHQVNNDKPHRNALAKQPKPLAPCDAFIAQNGRMSINSGKGVWTDLKRLEVRF